MMERLLLAYERGETHGCANARCPMGNSLGRRVGEGQENFLYLGTFADIVLVDQNRLGVEGFFDDCRATLPRWRSAGWT